MDSIRVHSAFSKVYNSLRKAHKCACDLCVAEQIAKLTKNQKLLARVQKIKEGMNG